MDSQDYTEDPDEGNNSVNQYYIQPPFRITQPLETQLRQRGEKDVFRIGRHDGVIRTNIYFQADMQGYFEFVVIVNDSDKGHQDSTNVSVGLRVTGHSIHDTLANFPVECIIENIFYRVFGFFYRIPDFPLKH